jgi:DNA-binding NtrC family response regulator
MKAGAENYFTKPFDVEQLKRTVSALLENLSLKVQVEGMQYQVRRQMERGTLYTGKSPKLREIYAMVERVASSDTTTVLIQGETGTGKEVLARRIHLASARRARPFLEINCAAIPANLVESELFGYEPGAFTDARKRKPGLFELANGGTLFLDEISDLAAVGQVKLLRFLETRCFKRVGGTQDVFTDVRIIAATNDDLAQAVKERRFRQDLYYRLKVMPLHMPALRERPEDILPLAQHFLGEFSGQFHKDAKRFSHEAIEKLCGYHWPGNVREMRNVVERAVLLSAGETLGCEHLPTEILLASAASAIPGLSVQAPLEDVEKKYILEVFTAHKQNLSQTARILQISRSTLREKLQRYGMAPGRRTR